MNKKQIDKLPHKKVTIVNNGDGVNNEYQPIPDIIDKLNEVIENFNQMRNEK